MAVIGVKSITGITSITNAAGAADVLTFHSNNTTERLRINSDGDVLMGGLTSKSSQSTAILSVEGGDDNIGILNVHSGGGETAGE